MWGKVRIKLAGHDRGLLVKTRVEESECTQCAVECLVVLKILGHGRGEGEVSAEVVGVGAEEEVVVEEEEERDGVNGEVEKSTSGRGMAERGCRGSL